LIDVREAGEVAQGVIPTSHHIPLANIQEALTLPDKEFEARFGELNFYGGLFSNRELRNGQTGQRHTKKGSTDTAMDP